MKKIKLLRTSFLLLILMLTQFIKINAQNCKVDTIYNSNLIYSSNVNFEKKPFYRTIIIQSNNDLTIEYLSQIYAPHLKKFRNYIKQSLELSASFKTIPTLTLTQIYDTISNAWINGEKEEKSLNSKGKIVNQSYFIWNKLNQTWKQSSNNNNTYINDTLLSEETTQYYVPYINSLRNYYKYIYTYDIKGNLLSEIYSEWDTLSLNFINYRKQTNTYTSSNKVESQTTDYWDKVNNRFNKHSINEYIYTISDKLNIYTYKTWDDMTSTYLNSSRKNVMYNIDDYESIEINQNYDIATSTWIDNYKHESDYHPNNLIKSKTTSNYNSGSMTWTPAYKGTTDYNTNGKKTKEYFYEWITASSEWQEKSLVINKYNSGDSILLYEYYQRNDGINGLEIYSKREYNYKVTNPIYTEISYRNYNNISGLFETVTMNEHLCKLANTNTFSPIINASMKLYPNPSNTGYIEISGNVNSEYKIYGVSGKLLLHGIISPNQRIDVKSLAPGIYIIKNEQQTSKFIIQ